MAATEQAKRPVTVLAGPYGHPLHPAAVTVPIGAWVSGLVFDIGSHLVSDGAFLAEGARWLIAVGVVGALVAALLGFADLLAIPAGTRAFRTALVHMGINLVVVLLFVVGFVVRGGDPVAPVPAGPLTLSVFALLALSVSGYLGGQLAYRYGVRVADEKTQAEGYLRVGTDAAAGPGPVGGGRA